MREASSFPDFSSQLDWTTQPVGARDVTYMKAEGYKVALLKIDSFRVSSGKHKTVRSGKIGW